MTFTPARLYLTLNESDTVATVIRRLLEQAEQQERVTTRYLYRESVLRYLTGAQLEINMGNHTPALHHELLQYWVWDQDCSAHYTIGNTMYVVTGTQGDPLLESLRQLVALGWRPLVISRDDRIEAINDLIAEADLLKHVSALSLEMFIYSSMRRKSVVTQKVLEASLVELLEMYNQIIEIVGAPPSLMIELRFVSHEQETALP